MGKRKKARLLVTGDVLCVCDRLIAVGKRRSDTSKTEGSSKTEGKFKTLSVFCGRCAKWWDYPGGLVKQRGVKYAQ